MKFPSPPYAARCLPRRTGRYRYLVEMDLSHPPRPRLVVILKNPSTASETRCDPTVGKVAAWARRRGFGSLAVVNLFALRSTRPAGLNRRSYPAAVGPENDRHIRAALRAGDVAVAAWGEPGGVNPESYERRIREVFRLAGPGRLKVVGALTRRGYPRHGLLWNGAPGLADWPRNPPAPGAFRRPKVPASQGGKTRRSGFPPGERA